ncbi:glycosyl hydrolase [Maribellus sediminis]|uniref:glycosyl hydrolase n=1 Tax=Maribellus sediminis TaxID=2696285 RepID=UPI001431E83E|nr:glycosyl hydrolase [Maribellus sediminis]
MRTIIPYLFLFLILIFSGCKNGHQSPEEFQPLGKVDDAKPWVYWFLTDASISKKGITRDLEAMKENGIGGAFLFTIRGAAEPSLYEPVAVQLTPEWWDMMKFAVSEANRLGVKLGIHACDGFTAAGGPWIAPELSMQKVVWADTIVVGGQHFEGQLPQPERMENYYEDIATFAYPAPAGSGVSSYKLKPTITTSIPGKDASFLAKKGNTENFSSREKCWIQYQFDEPFACRSITLQSGWNNYQANRLIVETSNDGSNFTRHGRLEAYRHGWDDRGVTVTHLIEPVDAKYFRFVFDPEGTEPGAEDLDDAKWRPRLRISGIELSGEAKIHQYEGKSGAVWRISKSTNEDYLQESVCIDPEEMIDISYKLGTDGKLSWDVPEGRWVILRMGHTSTGATNYIGGGGVGLEADKLNPEAVKVQFENWFDSIYNHMGDLAESTIEELYNDSWECGSQNWSPVLLNEFKQRRGYDLGPYLPALAGVPLRNTHFSEQVLHDVRTTIAEVLVDNYHGTMKKLAHEKGVLYSSESVAPVFVSDGMLHFKNTDAPTGEFWFRSPSHDKPNDILDAVSGAHIYGKKLVRAEAGTEIRLDWDEHPEMLKTLFDRNFAIGVNKMIFHVFVHDPWTDQLPGKTLGVVGTFFQPNQTWWKPGKTWINYIENCQTQLQQGIPVADIAVFTGEEIPRRAVLPDRLVPVLPGIFGKEKVRAEQQRLENVGQPYRQLPKGVTTLENLADPVDWVDPLNGYSYDSFNKDALLNLASVQDGKIVLPGGASYSLFVVPGERRMNPNGGMSLDVVQKLFSLVKDGAMIYFQEKPAKFLGAEEDELVFEKVTNELFAEENSTTISENLRSHKIGKGQVLIGKFDLPSFAPLDIEKDFFALENKKPAEKLAWIHRTDGEKEIYFIANQKNERRDVELSFRVDGKVPEFYFPVSGETRSCKDRRIENGRTIIPFQFESNESVFVLFEEGIVDSEVTGAKNNPEFVQQLILDIDWLVEFDKALGGPESPVALQQLSDWSKNKDEKIKYYSGTAVYRKSFEWSGNIENAFLDVGEVYNLAEVTINGINCGVAWTAPYRVDISKAIKEGTNQLEIAVTNTWANRLIGDHELPEEDRITWTTCAYRLEGNELLPAGMMGPVRILVEK